MNANPKKPRGLTTRAGRLWDEVSAAYELRSDEWSILEEACREMILIEKMEKELSGSPMMINGSKGQPVAHPLVQELRQHRMTLKALLGSLRLSDDDTGAGSSRSASARDAANARWRRTG